MVSPNLDSLRNVKINLSVVAVALKESVSLFPDQQQFLKALEKVLSEGKQLVKLDMDLQRLLGNDRMLVRAQMIEAEVTLFTAHLKYGNSENVDDFEGSLADIFSVINQGMETLGISREAFLRRLIDTAGILIHLEECQLQPDRNRITHLSAMLKNVYKLANLS